MTKKTKPRALCLKGRLTIGDQEGGHAFPYIEIEGVVLEAELEELLAVEIEAPRDEFPRDELTLAQTKTDWIITIAELLE